jgi:hypothetical protein
MQGTHVDMRAPDAIDVRLVGIVCDQVFVSVGVSCGCITGLVVPVSCRVLVRVLCGVRFPAPPVLPTPIASLP